MTQRDQARMAAMSYADVLAGHARDFATGAFDDDQRLPMLRRMQWALDKAMECEALAGPVVVEEVKTR